VKVKPVPLKRPKLIAVSPRLPNEMGLSDEACNSEAFLRFFSGDVDVLQGKLQSWATPYALSIFGQEMYNNCPFQNGNGYGDGRAQSVGEIVFQGQRWEMQLKGGGPTPFCRGADGRAVLRSSVREHLASEAMNAMGVKTTRGLSLIVSEEDTVTRAWFDKVEGPQAMILKSIKKIKYAPEEEVESMTKALLSRILGPDKAQQVMNHPSYTPSDGEEILASIAERFKQPDKMADEPCAIACRVAPSFLRVGHFELHGRRARRAMAKQEEREALELIVKHALKREFPTLDADASMPFQSKVIAMAEEVAKNLCKMVSDWIRVGYCQGNFNSDNCLVAGRTMDYGPFGFMEEFDPKWNMWTGGGEHFSFMNQPQAAERNFFSLMTALTPLMDGEGKKELQQVMDKFPEIRKQALDDMWRRKLGCESWDDFCEESLPVLMKLLAETGVDWTMFWRQLAEFHTKQLTESSSDDELIEVLEPAFYQGLNPKRQSRWLRWIRHWLEHSQKQSMSRSEQATLMKSTSPKYVPREWMLVKAYEAAYEGDYTLVQELQLLFDRPFDEQPQFEERYYRRSPPGAGEKGGTAYMT